MVSHSLNNNTHWLFYIPLFKYKSYGRSDHPESPQILDIYSVVVL